MANQPKQQREMMWLAALREVGHHVSKIGETITKFAEDSEKLLQNGHVEESEPKENSTSPNQTKNRDDDQNRVRGPAWANLGKHAFSRYNYASERPHAVPPHSYPMYYPPPPEYMPMPLRGNASYPTSDGREEDQDPDDQQNGARRKRRASTSAVETGPPGRAADRTDNRASGKGPRPAKRVRINWTEQENTTFFDTITKHSTLDEGSLLREIVDALGGSRNWIQCKGHFRNLVVVGRIVVRDGPPKRWVVLEEHEFKRAGSRTISAKPDKLEEAKSNLDHDKKGNLSEDLTQKDRNPDEPEDHEFAEDEEIDGADDDRGADADYNVNDDMDLDRENDELGDEEVLAAEGSNVVVDPTAGPDSSDTLHIAKKSSDEHQDSDRVKEAAADAAVSRALRKQNPVSGQVEDITKVQPFRRGREVVKRRSVGPLADARTVFARGK